MPPGTSDAAQSGTLPLLAAVGCGQKLPCKVGEFVILLSFNVLLCCGVYLFTDRVGLNISCLYILEN